MYTLNIEVQLLRTCTCATTTHGKAHVEAAWAYRGDVARPAFLPGSKNQGFRPSQRGLEWGSRMHGWNTGISGMTTVNGRRVNAAS